MSPLKFYTFSVYRMLQKMKYFDHEIKQNQAMTSYITHLSFCFK